MKKLTRFLCGLLVILTANMAGMAQAADLEGGANRRHPDRCRCRQCRVVPAAPVQVPEPSTLLLLGAGLVSLGILRRRKS